MVREEDFDNILESDLTIPYEMHKNDKIGYPVRPTFKPGSKNNHVFEWLFNNNATISASLGKPHSGSWIKVEPRALESTFK